jgi:hypothetical protein
MKKIFIVIGLLAGIVAVVAGLTYVFADVFPAPNPKWGYVDWWRPLIAFPEGIAAWAVIATLLVIGWQSWETRKAAQAGRDAAIATLQNAQALVNSERPWLIAEAKADDRQPHFFRIEITNCGRTPARFLRGDAAYIVTQRPDQLPVPPTYSAPMILPEQLLIAPGTGFPVPHGYSISHLIKDLNSETLVILGRVVYEDTIIPGVEHETRWCFGYVLTAPYGGKFILTGPNEYTANT